MVEDDEWDKATSHQKVTCSSAQDDGWGTENTSYQPSANTYQRSGASSYSAFDEKPKIFNRSENNSYGGRGRRENSGGDNRRDNFSNDRRDDFGRGFDQKESRSSYSNDNKIAYRSFDNPPQSTTTTIEVKLEYEVIDWAKANKEADAARKARWDKCPIMVKNFYTENPEVTNMSDEDVDIFRQENKNIVVSRTFANEASTDPMPKPTTKFEHAFEKFPDLMAEIKKAGFEKPSPIQSQMWPILMAGEDCIGIAQTGTGKTLAFLLPALIHIDGQPHPRGIEARGGPNVLVLAPTRELAIQIETEVAKYQFRGIRAWVHLWRKMIFDWRFLIF